MSQARAGRPARLSTEHTQNLLSKAGARRRSSGADERLEEWIRRPVSRVLCRPAKTGRGGHSSGPAIAGRFSRPTRTTGPAKPVLQAETRRRVVPIRSCSRRGLPCRPRRRVRGGLLPHPFTLTRRLSGGRFAFCGAFPGVAPGGRYPPPFRRGARTFLALRRGEKRDRPAV